MLRDWAPAFAGEAVGAGRGTVCGFGLGFSFGAGWGMSIGMPGIIACCACAADGSSAATAQAVTSRGRFITSPSRNGTVDARSARSGQAVGRGGGRIGGARNPGATALATIARRIGA